MAKRSIITVKDVSIRTMTVNGIDYICITDIAKQKNEIDPAGVIANWMRNRNTIEYLGLWETLYNPNFNPLEFEGVRNQAGLITSIEIAELTGKMHKHVMEAIRKMEPAWESERGTNLRLSQIREKISNNGYNRLPEVFTKEDVIRCFGYDNDSSARGKIKRLVDDGIISKEDAVDENGNTSSIYKKVKLMI